MNVKYIIWKEGDTWKTLLRRSDPTPEGSLWDIGPQSTMKADILSHATTNNWIESGGN